jgi:3-deoxy-D-manno-octulosonic-acid transferase
MDGTVKFIIAPHETNKERIASLIQALPFHAVKYSELNNGNVKEFRILVIDSIGILMYLYKYATIAYIGGGFGTGIHNILEAAAVGAPVVFGPNYSKFREAVDLISRGGAFSIRNVKQLDEILHRLLNDASEYTLASTMCKNYVQEKKGSTDKILDKIDDERKKICDR